MFSFIAITDGEMDGPKSAFALDANKVAGASTIAALVAGLFAYTLLGGPESFLPTTPVLGGIATAIAFTFTLDALHYTYTYYHITRPAKRIIGSDTNEMRDDKKLFIYELMDIPSREIEEVINYASRIIGPRRYPFSAWSDIIAQIAFIPSELRLDFIVEAERRIALLPVNPDNLESRSLRHICSTLVREYREQIETQPRRNYEQPEREQHNLPVPATPAEGIDVHAGTRDARLRDAVQLLRQHQGRLSEATIDLAVQQFTDYLNGNDHRMPTDTDEEFEANKQLARQALLAPRNDEPWGPLLGPNFSILGLSVSGKEIVGRLWIFASAIADVEDQKNAKVGMINALKNSYNLGVRVCNGGKTHRLVTAVLQGRLAGIDIDGGLRPTLNQAVSSFFDVEAHRSLTGQELTVAAEKFYNESPLLSELSREDFIHEIASCDQI